MLIGAGPPEEYAQIMAVSGNFVTCGQPSDGIMSKVRPVNVLELEHDNAVRPPISRLT
ncbi:hypothetical protein SAMN05444920_109221 [Nonomuraea solani]|uniref:Uncharacterized protein n=1 Tax=Nonomuraea solani TaxID=1144553 RepID=A0A1H6EDT6_9ACTN|nr:hypothetical protein [Nonomuraea solani]SEG95977.1 hypothetical protein SAMN05444920_109221 [Nonomuraea solani]